MTFILMVADNYPPAGVAGNDVKMCDYSITVLSILKMCDYSVTVLTILKICDYSVTVLSLHII